jgi:hypothetical protein
MCVKVAPNGLAYKPGDHRFEIPVPAVQLWASGFTSPASDEMVSNTEIDQVVQEDRWGGA